MKLEQNVRIQKQSQDGSMSITFPKQFAKLLGYAVKDTLTISLDTETKEVSVYKKECK